MNAYCGYKTLFVKELESGFKPGYNLYILVCHRCGKEEEQLLKRPSDALLKCGVEG